MASTLEFWFDLTDPWSWIAAPGVVQAANEAGVTVTWQPVALPSPHPFTNPARQAVLDADLAREVAARGRADAALRVDEAACHAAMAALRELPPASREPAALAALSDVWEHDRAPELTGDPAGLEEARHQAEAAGWFATPTLVVDGMPFWGADRMRFVRRALGLEEARQAFGRARPGTRVRWYHDFSSPFSYLSATQIRRFEAETGAVVEPVPILLGALFRAIETPMIPLHAFSAARQRWAVRDMTLWADWWAVPFRFPETFPLRTVAALRVALVDPSTVEAMYQAAWANNQDIGDPEVLAQVLTTGGFDGPGLLQATQDPAIKERLKVNTEQAQARGVCGVPTFELPDGTLMWGQDRIDAVARALA